MKSIVSDVNSITVFICQIQDGLGFQSSRVIYLGWNLSITSLLEQVLNLLKLPFCSFPKWKRLLRVNEIFWHIVNYYLLLPLHGNRLLINHQLPDLMVLWQAVCNPSLERRGTEGGPCGKAGVPVAKERADEGTGGFEADSRKHC